MSIEDGEIETQEQELTLATGAMDMPLGSQALSPIMEQPEQVEVKPENYEVSAEKIAEVSARYGAAISIIEKYMNNKYSSNGSLSSNFIVAKIYDELK